jgi:CRISPR/Cas system CSM-associated protein Csm3 (group 7 of RAMP superfamily)
MEWKHFKITLETQEPFRIGALKDPLSGIDNPVAMIGGKFTVQGPSLKGALRAEIERYLIEQYGTNAAMKPCIPSSAGTLSAGENALINAGKFKRGGNCEYKEAEERGRRGDQSHQATDYICPACYLLGAQGLVGFVRVPCLFTTDKAETLYSVRIDRASGTVAERTNREYQIIPQGTLFVGVMDVLWHDPVREWRLGQKRALASALTRGDAWLEASKWTSEKLCEEFIVQRLQAIKLLGGFKSKGAGGVKITVTEVK